jgi:two-component system cell cycle response regulator DivK
MRRKRILCIEDNDSNMRLVSRIVEGEKHEFLTAADGLTALSMVQRERPDLILLDINIPGLNGLELARRLKGDPNLSSIPLIATTANVLLGDRERCLEAGCDEYLPKPLDVRELQSILRSYLGNPVRNQTF